MAEPRTGAAREGANDCDVATSVSSRAYQVGAFELGNERVDLVCPHEGTARQVIVGCERTVTVESLESLESSRVALIQLRSADDKGIEFDRYRLLASIG